MSHYDYLSPHAGLSGLDASALMQTGAKIVAQAIGSDKNKDQAWNFFRFGDMALSEAERLRRFETWTQLTEPFKIAMQVQAQIDLPAEAGMSLAKDKVPLDPAKLTLDQKSKVQRTLKGYFETEWKKVFGAPVPPAATFPLLSRTGLVIDPRVSLLATRPIVPAGAGAGPSSSGGSGGSGGSGDTEKKFPVVPVAIGAAALAAILLMRKK